MLIWESSQNTFFSNRSVPTKSSVQAEERSKSADERFKSADKRSKSADGGRSKSADVRSRPAEVQITSADVHIQDIMEDDRMKPSKPKDYRKQILSIIQDICL